jgi:hypothetical protein
MPMATIFILPKALFGKGGLTYFFVCYIGSLENLQKPRRGHSVA